MKLKRLRHALRYWIPLALVYTLLSGLVYLSVQQVLRTSANDPQIQIAEDSASSLSRNGDPSTVVPAMRMDITNSLSPFVIVYNDEGAVINSSGLLHGQVPSLPKDVLMYVRSNGEDRLTWQPEPQVRIAAVITRYAGEKQGFVLVGRSLREVEIRENNLFLQVVAVWGAGIIVSGIIALLLIP